MTEGCRKSDLTDGYKVPGVSKKVPPPPKKLFGIFSLWLCLFA